MEIKILNTKGQETGKTVELNDSIFNIEPNDNAIYIDVKQHLANKRQGTHKTKERNEITGSRRKIKRQKGTGTARAGDIKSPIFRGGGRTFGPRPRDYGFKLNKKLKKIARKSALSYKAQNSEIIVIENFEFDKPKTKNFIDLLNNLKIDDKKSVFILQNKNKNIYLSSKNLKKSKVITVTDLNTYNILNHNNLVFDEKSIELIQGTLAK